MAHPEGFLPSTQQPTRMEGGMRPPGSRAFPDASNDQLMAAIHADHEAIMRGGDPLRHMTDQLAVDVIAERTRAQAAPVRSQEPLAPPVPVAEEPVFSSGPHVIGGEAPGQKSPISDWERSQPISVTSDKPMAEAIQAERKHAGGFGANHPMSGHMRRVFPL